MSLDARIDSILSAALAAGVMPNMVVLVGDRDGVRCVSAAGARTAGDPGSADVGPACLYRLGSMTKPIVIVAALQLCERGLLDLDVPVGDHLPAFDRLQVLEGFDGDTPRMRPPASRALVRHLITQTAGLGYDFINDAQRRWQEVTGIPNSWAGDERVFSSPLHFDPGTAGQYGLGVDWLGRIIESVTGQGLDRALLEMVTGPLGMADTTFAPSAAQRRALVPIHLPNGTGGWGATELDFPLAPDWWSGGHGLYSTASDYLRFTRMLLNDGELDGVRVLQARTVDEVFQDHNVVAEIPVGIPTADPALAMETGPRPGVGLGLLVNKIDLPGMRAAWSGSFAGLYNTCFVVDRTRGRTWVALSQCAGGHLPAMLEVNIALEQAIYAEPG